jgi:MFS family permease
MTVAACIVHLAPALVDKGFSRELAAGFAGIAGFATLAGKLTIGWVFDRVRLVIVTTGLTIFLGLGCALLALVDGQASVALVACIAFGAAAGATYAISACLVTRFFPVKDFGLVFGTLSGFIALAGALAPAAASMIHDRFGSYMIVFWCGVILCAMSGVLLATLTPAARAVPASADPELVR